MEHCMTLKVKDRWIEDKEVTHCSACNAEFTLFLRKVSSIFDCVVNNLGVFVIYL